MFRERVSACGKLKEARGTRVASLDILDSSSRWRFQGRPKSILYIELLISGESEVYSRISVIRTPIKGTIDYRNVN